MKMSTIHNKDIQKEVENPVSTMAKIEKLKVTTTTDVSKKMKDTREM